MRERERERGRVCGWVEEGTQRAREQRKKKERRKKAKKQLAAPASPLIR
jgi:hypothetical protein